MVRTPSRDKSGLKKGTWTPEEDAKLIAYVTRYGCWNWRQLPRFAGLERCGKSCRLRWMNYLRPNIKRGNFTQQEDDLLVRLHSKLGNRWSTIAAELPGRTDNEVKNHWHTNLKKRFPENSERNEKFKSKLSKLDPVESDHATQSVSKSNKSILQSTPATSHNSSSRPMSPLSSSSGFSGTSTETSGHSNENLFPEDDLAFLNSYTESVSSDFWIDDTYGRDISFVPGETSLESAVPLQTPTSSSSSESFVMGNDFAFIDADIEPMIENFWSEAYTADTFYNIINPIETVTPSLTETELFSSVYDVDTEFWDLNQLSEGYIGLFQ